MGMAGGCQLLQVAGKEGCPCEPAPQIFTALREELFITAHGEELCLNSTQREGEIFLNMKCFTKKGKKEPCEIKN